jgi:hypothetical protein
MHTMFNDTIIVLTKVYLWSLHIDDKYKNKQQYNSFLHAHI